MSGEGRQTAAADRGDAAALGLDPPPRLRVVDRGDELLLALAHLRGQRALAGLGQELVRRKPPADLRAEPEPIEPARGEDNGVEPALAAFAQPRVDVAA